MLDTVFNESEDESEDDDIIEVPENISLFPKRKVNFVNNKDMLKEIHKSKNTFSEYIEPKYGDYDVIVGKLDSIYLGETQAQGQLARAGRLTAIAFESALLAAGDVSKIDRPKLSAFKVSPDTIQVEDLVYRVMCFDHIPLAPGRKKTPKSTADEHLKLNFPPFKHYVLVNGAPKEVGRSHTKNGKFSLEHGMITNTLARMYILMVNKYGQRGNWRGYSYLDEMKGQALLQLTHMGLQFDEMKSENPFSYFTQSISNAFTRVFNMEKKNQDVRDDLLVDSGACPSFSRQLAVEHEIRILREEAIVSSKDIQP